MTEYFFILPVVLGWLMVISAVLQYIFYLKNKTFSRKYKLIFIIVLVLWLISLGIWTFVRNL